MAKTKELPTLKELFTRSANGLQRYGWKQRAFGPEQITKGPHCAAGIMRAVIQYDNLTADFETINRRADLYHQAMRLAEEHLHHSITSWNDSFGRTKKEVVQLFRDLAASL